MNLCIPVDEDQGLESPVCAHFGSAPLFLVVDTQSGQTQTLRNRDRHHGHGMCRPLASLAGVKLDGIVAGGIGRRALGLLQKENLRVFLSDRSTVKETLEAFRGGALRAVTPATACGHHGRGRACE